MRFLAASAIALGIAVCVAVIYLSFVGYMQWRRRYLERHSRWVEVSVDTNDTTYISVQRVAETITGRVVLDEKHIGFVGHNNPAYAELSHQFQMLAWERAMELNAT